MVKSSFVNVVVRAQAITIVGDCRVALTMPLAYFSFCFFFFSSFFYSLTDSTMGPIQCMLFACRSARIKSTECHSNPFLLPRLAHSTFWGQLCAVPASTNILWEVGESFLLLFLLLYYKVSRLVLTRNWAARSSPGWQTQPDNTDDVRLYVFF